MKLGYLFIPPAGGQSRRPGHAAAMRAPLAKALGFSEFYAPLTPSEDTPGPHATERQSLLHILPNPPEQLRPQLVLVDGQSRDRGRPAPGPVAAPVSHAAQARMHSARGRAPLSVSWSDTDMLARHWAAHVTGCTHAGRCARPQDWRVARTVIVDPDAARAEATLTDAIESIAAGFALFDSDDRLVLCNRQYRGSNPVISKMAVPGVWFEDIIRNIADAGLFNEEISKDRDFVEKRLALHRNTPSDYEQRLADGR